MIVTATFIFMTLKASFLWCLSFSEGVILMLFIILSTSSSITFLISVIILKIMFDLMPAIKDSIKSMLLGTLSRFAHKCTSMFVNPAKRDNDKITKLLSQKKYRSINENRKIMKTLAQSTKRNKLRVKAINLINNTFAIALNIISTF